MDRRQRLRPTTLAERVRLVWMWVEGTPLRIIAEETGTSVTTMSQGDKAKMEAPVTLVLVMTTLVSLCVSQVLYPNGSTEALSVAREALGDVLATVSHPHSSLIFLTDGTTSAATLFMMRPPWGISVLEVTVNSQDAVDTQARFSRAVKEARKVGHE
ncbi:putative olfactory ionotropic receptor IR7-like 4, partial [Homarus americanus]